MSTPTLPGQRKSRMWYLVPIFLDIIGGLIAYLILKDEDPALAKNCLILGVVLTIIPIIILMMLFGALLI